MVGDVYACDMPDDVGGIVAALTDVIGDDPGDMPCISCGCDG
jgi:hypothetical protein